MAGLRPVLLTAFVLALGSPIKVSQWVLAGLTLLWLWRLRDPAGRRRASWPLAAPVAALSAVTVLSALASGRPAESLLVSKVLLALALYVTADLLSDARDADRFLSGLVLVGAAAAALGLAQVVLCPGQARDYGPPAWLYHRCYRARGPYSIYMTLAGVLTPLLLAALPRLLPPGGRLRWLPAWLVMLGGLIATQTRGAWIGFAAGAVALLPVLRRGRWLVVLGLLALALGALAGPHELRQRFLKMADPQEAGVTERVYMWRSGLAMWREHPWLGVGPGGVTALYPRYALPEAGKKRTSHVHSTPVQILVERGLLGLAAWCWLWVAFYRKAIGLWRALPPEAGPERQLAAGSLGALTGFLVAGLSEYNFGDAEVVLAAWVLMALPFVVARERAPARPAAGP